jgi:hypothetical protein
MKKSEISSWEKHASDLYILLNDIVENMNLQRHGYKLQFYYAFNPNLPYMEADGSNQSQEKLLVQLKDKNILNYAFALPGVNTVSDEISLNANKFPRATIMYLTVDPEFINKELPVLKQYEPSRLTASNDLSVAKKTKISSNGYLYIPDQSIPISFKVHQNSYKMLYIILSNKENRQRVWKHSELLDDLDVPAGIQTDKFVGNTAKNINTKIAGHTSPQVVGFLVVKDKKEHVDELGHGFQEQRTIHLNDRFV